LHLEDEGWYDENRGRLESAYLAADNPRGQSGFSGDAARWELARRPIAESIGRDGTFLDIGCASGLLMESVAQWAAEGGLQVEPYGLDISTRLAALARARLPHWADRIYSGNASIWEPPHRFDTVRTELVYVPERARPGFVSRLLDTFLLPGGRLLVCSYGSSRRPAPRVEPIDAYLRSWGFTVTGVRTARDPDNGIPVTRVAWVEQSFGHEL
jgi:SAM-dependent methyltransferase